MPKETRVFMDWTGVYWAETEGDVIKSASFFSLDELLLLLLLLLLLSLLLVLPLTWLMLSL